MVLYLLPTLPTPLWPAEADLSGANLTEADLSGAILIRANLRGAAMDETDFAGAILPDGGISSDES